MRAIAALAMAVLLGPGCGESGGLDGTLGAPCRADGSCEPGLSCLVGLCVAAPDSGPGWDLLSPRWDGIVPSPDLALVDGLVDPDTSLADAASPQPDQAQPLPDGPVAADAAVPPSCTQWSAWSCIGWPQPGVACWSSCPGLSGNLWCTSNGDCFCTSGSSQPCATGLSVSFGAPCGACQQALQGSGCCLP